MSMKNVLRIGFFIGLAGVGIWLRQMAMHSAAKAMKEDKHDQSLEDTFPASDPVCS